MDHVLGIDIGGSGVKGAPVDLEVGDFATDRLRIPTPEESTPDNVAEVVAQIVEHFADQIGDTPVGITFPGPIVHGKIPMVANLDQSWTNLAAEQFFSDKLGRAVTVVNDADAAGVAEVHFGAAKGVDGFVIVTTLGTGIGSAIINHGVLLPNSELGHLEIDGYDAEFRASSAAKDREDLSYKHWARERLQAYYTTLEALFCPDLFVVGGGVSKDYEKFMPLLQLRTPMVPAALRNKAGIIGAAWLAKDRLSNPDKIPDVHENFAEQVEEVPLLKTLVAAQKARAKWDKKASKKHEG